VPRGQIRRPLDIPRRPPLPVKFPPPRSRSLLRWIFSHRARLPVEPCCGRPVDLGAAPVPKRTAVRAGRGVEGGKGPTGWAPAPASPHRARPLGAGPPGVSEPDNGLPTPPPPFTPTGGGSPSPLPPGVQEANRVGVHVGWIGLGDQQMAYGAGGPDAGGPSAMAVPAASPAAAVAVLATVAAGRVDPVPWRREATTPAAGCLPLPPLGRVGRRRSGARRGRGAPSGVSGRRPVATAKSPHWERGDLARRHDSPPWRASVAPLGWRWLRTRPSSAGRGRIASGGDGPPSPLGPDGHGLLARPLPPPPIGKRAHWGTRQE